MTDERAIDRLRAALDKTLHDHWRELEPICEGFGYGATMQLASDQWGIKLATIGATGGELRVGPCVAQTVECGCDVPHQCEWCCGSQWLTKHVKAIKQLSEQQ